MEGLDILLQVLELRPENYVLRSRIAKIQYDMGKYEDSYKNYHYLYEMDRSNLEVLENMFNCLIQLEEYDEAKELAQSEMWDRPQWAFGFLIMAKCMFYKGKYTDALSYYQEAINIRPELADDELYQSMLEKSVIQDLNSKAKEYSYEIPGEIVIDGEIAVHQVSFKDVGGMENVKESIRVNIIFPLQNAGLFKAYGKSAGGGILLYGPPGCGKTFIAKATAGECNSSFISISITDILDIYIGESEKNLHAIFEEARQKRPAVIFIDEIDAIGGSRQVMKATPGRSLTNQLLTEMDRTQTDNTNLLIIGATNTPWHVDSALRRPGRFDRILFIPPPDLDARIEILKIHLKDKPCEDIDYLQVAKSMNKYSGADIKGVCDLASESAIKKAMAVGKIVPIGTDDLIKSIGYIRPSTMEWLNTAKNYATYSNQSGLYDDILEYFNKNI